MSRLLFSFVGSLMAKGQNLHQVRQSCDKLRFN